MHGFAGYFEAVLYKEVKLSIRPETHSPGMFSWFPILFPVKVRQDTFMFSHVFAQLSQYVDFELAIRN